MKKPYIFNSADWREILGKDYFLKCISEEKKENSSVKVCCLMHLQIKHTRCYHVIKFLVVQERGRSRMGNVFINWASHSPSQHLPKALRQKA